MSTDVVKTTQTYVKELTIDCTVLLHEDKILKALRKIWEYDARSCEEDKARSTMEDLVCAWFSNRIKQKYQEISPKIFDLQREIVVDLSKYYVKGAGSDNPSEKINLNIPVFCVSEGRRWEHKHSFERPRKDSSYRDRVEIVLSSERRPMPDKIKKASTQATAYIHTLYAEALTTYPLDEVLFEHEKIFPKPSDAKMLTLWQPKASDLKIDVKVRQVDRDPLLILKYERPYLVTAWQEPDELPFDDILSEALGKGQATIDDIIAKKM